MRVYLDTCLWIYAVEDPAGRGQPVLDELLSRLDSQDICLSDLVRMECLVEPLRDQNDELKQQYEKIWMLGTSLDVTRQDFYVGASLRAEHRLKTPDALHVAIAINNGCDQFWTNDSRLAKLADTIKMRVLP